jgi:hypothetical protein
MLIVEDPTVTVKYRTAIKALLLYSNLCLKGERNQLMIGVLQNLELIKKWKCDFLNENFTRAGVKARLYLINF